MNKIIKKGNLYLYRFLFIWIGGKTMDSLSLTECVQKLEVKDSEAIVSF